jgi:streptogramin lyase
MQSMRPRALVCAALTVFLLPSTSAAAGVAITEYAIPTAASGTMAIASGPDGNLWFAESGTNKIGKITPAGVITEFSLPVGSNAMDIAAGPDGNLWFTDKGGNSIGKITPAGAITELPLSSPFSNPQGITAGPDGNVWFTELRCGFCDPRPPNNGGTVGKITPGGAITEFTLPTYFSDPWTITSGPDGNLWFVERASNQFGRISPAGVIFEFANADGDYGFLVSITSGPDGNLWFTKSYFPCAGSCLSPSKPVGKITLGATVTEFLLPNNGGLIDIARGPDANLWFTDRAGLIGRITPAGTITEFATPSASSSPSGITTGPDGNLWFVETGANNIGKLVLAPAGATTADLPALSTEWLIGLAAILATLGIRKHQSC